MDKMVKVARLQFLVPALAIYLMGGLWAWHQGTSASLLVLLVGSLVALAATVSVHISNDYFDIGSDVRGHITLISGGSGVLIDHPELRQAAKWTAVGLILFSLAVGAVFLWMAHASFWFFGLMLLGNLIGWFYSAPPLRFSHGVGEWCYPLLGGFLTPALGYLAVRGRLDMGGVFLVVPLLLLTLAGVLAVEIPDVEADQQGNKKTWVRLHGRKAGFTTIGIIVLAVAVYFFISPWLFPSFGTFRPWFAGLIALVPVSAGLAGWILRPVEERPATRLAVFIVFSVSAFCLLVDGYLIWLILSSG